MSTYPNVTPTNSAQQRGNDDDTSSRVAVLMLPFPGHNHINQLLHLSRSFLSYNISVHFVSTLVTPARRLAENINIHFHEIQIPFSMSNTKSLSPNTPSSDSLPYLIHLHCEPAKMLVERLSKEIERIIVIHDSLMFKVARMVLATCSTLIAKQDIYSFASSSAFCYYVTRQLLMGKPILIDGEPTKNLSSLQRNWSMMKTEFKDSLRESHTFNHRNIINTSRVIEGQFINLIAEKTNPNELDEDNEKWAIGPLNSLQISVREGSTNVTHRDKCLEWLAKQSQNSVLFVCFGTTTEFSTEQIREICIGLEKSGHCFIWVVPETQREDGKDGAWPKDFENRVRERGLIVKDWVTQLEILSHCSTGGFLTYCGWNSCIESISMGVPMAAWPINTDQPMNAILITQILKVGLMVGDWENRNELVKSSSIEEVVKRLMGSDEGNQLRQKAKELSDAVKGSVKEGRCATEEMEAFIAHITRHEKSSNRLTNNSTSGSVTIAGEHRAICIKRNMKPIDW
ncbi:OLC1v1036726C1 [Oldenlandia corymbosa var. corymbosa]|uniref:OLC1v1036726C1 n=1 Tax=Oldenlandia corymbosa var. corymbosa TaxID=529605 RepID=A0AAV1CVW8_OLDCO|nr:OLC1v1036726C1 [Oldenlandia corymbosa var. corymbosa]